MKLWKRQDELSEETRLSLKILGVVLGILAVVLVLDQLLGQRNDSIVENREKRVIVKEVAPQPPQKPLPQSVVDSVRDAIKQGNYSTAYLEIAKAAPGTPQNSELRQMLEGEQKKRRPGLRKQSESRNVLHYYDETTPRDRATDWVFVSFTEQGGAFWPKLTIQMGVAKPLEISTFRLVADGRSYDLPEAGTTAARSGDKLALLYETPLDQRGYTAIRAAARARKASLVAYRGAAVVRTRELSPPEKQGLERIMEAYVAVGGNLSFLGTPEVSKGGGRR